MTKRKRIFISNLSKQASQATVDERIMSIALTSTPIFKLGHRFSRAGRARRMHGNSLDGVLAVIIFLSLSLFKIVSPALLRLSWQPRCMTELVTEKWRGEIYLRNASVRRCGALYVPVCAAIAQCMNAFI